MTPKIPEALIDRKCSVCAHCRMEEPNEDSALSALHATFRSPCQIYAIAQIDFDEPECKTFVPRLWVAGICQTCIQRNRFFPTGCRLEKADRRIVYRTSRPIAQAECYTCEEYAPSWMADRMITPSVVSRECASVRVCQAPPMRPLTNAELVRLQGLPEHFAVGMRPTARKEELRLRGIVKQQQITMDLEDASR